MMPLRSSLLAALLVVACGPRSGSPPAKTESDATPAAPAVSPVWIAASLNLQANDAATALKAPFEDAIPVVNSAKVAATASSCDDYFRLKAEGYGAVSEEDHSLWRSEGVRCETIKRSSAMRPGRGEPAKELLADARLPHHLPATVGPSVSPDELALRKASEAQGKSWSDYAPGVSVELLDGVAVVREADTMSRLRPLATGDVNGDGESELLLEAVCSGTEGSWVDIRLLVLAPVTHADGTRVFRLVESVAP